MKKLLYSLLFIYSSLFSTTITTWSFVTSTISDGEVNPLTCADYAAYEPTRRFGDYSGTQHELCPSTHSSSLQLNDGWSRYKYDNFSCTYDETANYRTITEHTFVECLWDVVGDDIKTCSGNQVLTADNTCKTDTNDDGIADIYDLILSPTCSNNQYLDANNTCVTHTFEYSPAYSSISKEQCEDNIGQSVNNADKLGKYVAWDYASGRCVFDLLKCPLNQYIDENTKTCISPPNQLNLENNMECEGDIFGFRGYKNFCTSTGIGYISQTTQDFMDKYSLKAGKNYAEYACVKDYRKKKFKEVSCTHIANEDNNYTYTESDFVYDITKETNTTTLSAIDPTQATLQNSSQLSSIDDAIRNILAPKIDETNEKLTIIKTSIDGVRSSVNGVKSSVDAVKSSVDGVKDGVDDVKSSVDDVKSSVDTVNQSLNQNGGLTGSEEILDTSKFNIDASALNDTSIMDNLADNISDLTDGITSIKDDFTTTKELISGEKPSLQISSGSCSDENMLKFAGYLSRYSSIIALVTYIGFMISIFKMIFAYFARGE